jgi:hypothetical protein
MSYKIIVDNPDHPERCEEHRGPGCRARMLRRWHELVRLAEQTAAIRRIEVIGTVGNKLDTVLLWPLS